MLQDFGTADFLNTNDLRSLQNDHCGHPKSENMSINDISLNLLKENAIRLLIPYQSYV